ncbi:MAG TPA: hypothetical protein VIL97_01480 [Thermoanaerobaculia bacterium]
MDELSFIQDSEPIDVNEECDLFSQTGWEHVRFIVEEILSESDPEK